MPRQTSAQPCVVVLVTCPNQASARRIAARLVEERLAACVNVMPHIRSFFRWQGRLERSPEVLLIIKTRKIVFPRLVRTILQVHPYKVPEIIALPIILGNQPYLDWVRHQTHSGRTTT